ncbi:MAG: DRTGG domain-containing protein [candidate division KSB1 bacterium]|nr:DRTGG domain-containing protein [candidate division KSB1 bacterium]
MTLAEVKTIVQADVLTSHIDLSQQVHAACASDMMSDVLAFAAPATLVITGLATQQTLRTAEIADAAAIVFVRGKRPNAEVIAIADQKKIPLLATEYCMHDACGLLYSKGLGGVTEQVRKRLIEHGRR